MKLAVLALGDASSVRTWSGTPYFMERALRSRFPDLLAVSAPQPKWQTFLRRAVRKATGGRIDLAWSATLSKWNAGRLIRLLKSERIDVVLAVGCAPLSAYIGAHMPTIHVSDATVPLMLDYYADFSRLLKSFAERAVILDKTSVLRARIALFSTEWSASSAIRDYGADPSRVHIIPWGCNIDDADIPDGESRVDSDGPCRLVFIGVEWERKGGAIAVEALRKLRADGHNATLDIVGATPPPEMQGDGVVAHGFLNKDTSEGREKLRAIMRGASFLFVPTRQDCSPMVFAEANSFGIPVITTDTGGVSGIVRESVNGHMLPIEAGAADYADLIWKTWSANSYAGMRTSARREFEEVSNWGSWATRATPFIQLASALHSAASAVPAPSRSGGGQLG